MILLNNESTRWLCKRRIPQKLQNIPKISNIVSEWGNVKTIISEATDDSLWKYEAFTQKKKLKIWDDEINLFVQQNNHLSRKNYLPTKTIENEIEYKRRRALAKREHRKRHRKSWEEFISHLWSAIYKIKPNKFEIIQHMKKDYKIIKYKLCSKERNIFILL